MKHLGKAVQEKKINYNGHSKDFRITIVKAVKQQSKDKEYSLQVNKITLARFYYLNILEM